MNYGTGNSNISHFSRHLYYNGGKNGSFFFTKRAFGMQLLFSGTRLQGSASQKSCSSLIFF
jgi:hypothetical protein